MSVGDFSQDPHRSTKTIGLSNILNLIQAQQKGTPKIEDDDLLRFFAYSPLIDLHDSEVAFGEESLLSDEVVNHFGLKSYVKRIPQSAKTHGLEYYYIRPENLQFAKPGTGLGTKFNGGMMLTLAQVGIVSNPILDFIDDVSFAFWIKKTADINDVILQKGTFANRNICFFFNPNHIIFEWYETDGVRRRRFLDIVEGTWTHIVFTFSTTNGVTIFKNGVEDSTQQESNEIRTNDEPLRIGSSTNNSSGCISWLSIIKGDVSQIPDWITNDFNGLRDFTPDGLEEIVTFPFDGNPRPQPIATTGLFYA